MIILSNCFLLLFKRVTSKSFDVFSGRTLKIINEHKMKIKGDLRILLTKYSTYKSGLLLVYVPVL